MEKYEIEKLRDLSIEEVAQQLGMQVARHKSLCPFHDDHHASLSFDKKRNICRCFVCMTESMDSITLAMKYLHVDFPKACHWLAEKFGVSLMGKWGRNPSSRNPSSRNLPSGNLPSGNPSSPASASISPARENPDEEKPRQFDASRYARFFEHPWLSDEARKFLFDERKIDPRVARWCRLSSWQDREGTHWLQTPYFDIEGKLVGIQNRNLDYRKKAETAATATSRKDSASQKGQAPRFRFPSGAKCSIYNLPVVQRLRHGDELYITEGCSDCWAMLSAGNKAIAIPSATLLLPEDKQLLGDLSERFAIQWHMYPDRDVPGESLFLQLRELLPGIVHHQLPGGCKDFGDFWKSKD